MKAGATPSRSSATASTDREPSIGASRRSHAPSAARPGVGRASLPVPIRSPGAGATEPRANRTIAGSRAREAHRLHHVTLTRGAAALLLAVVTKTRAVRSRCKASSSVPVRSAAAPSRQCHAKKELGSLARRRARPKILRPKARVRARRPELGSADAARALARRPWPVRPTGAPAPGRWRRRRQ